MRPEIMALSSFNMPIQTVLIRKVGSLYLKMLFYYLDQFKIAEDPYALKQGAGLNFEVPLPLLNPIEDVRFVLYRDPLDRLVAFYYDELFYKSERTWYDWRKALAAKGAKFDINCSLRQHQKNIFILLKHIQKMSQESGMVELPDQIAPQYKFLLPAIDLGFMPIDLIRTNFELANLMSSFVPDSAGLLQKIEQSVRPLIPYEVRNLMSSHATKLHRELYAGDFELYWAYRDGAA